MTAADEAAILAVLEAVPNLRVFDGHVTDSDESAKTISAPLPYVVFHRLDDDETVGDDLAGGYGARIQDFQVTYVGLTPEQAAAVRDRQRSALNRQWITMPAGQRLVRRSDDSFPISRDDTWSRPDGAPLFYGADRYTVGA